MTDPGMRRTSWGDLLVPFAVIGITAYVLLRFSYNSLPPLKFIVAAPLAALAVAESIAARRVRAAVRHDPDAKPMAAIVIARCVALGKASSLVGAGVVGAAAALLLRLVPDVGAVQAASDDALVGAVLLAAALLLVGAGLLLERSGIDPGHDERRR
ncbi:MAG: DUF3180 family protein [Jatrophihabitans sp.]